MTTRVTIDYRALRAQLERATLPARTDIAHRVVDSFQAAAPVLSGDYKADAEVVIDDAKVSVVANDPVSVHKEYGTFDTPPVAALTNAAREFGKYTGWKPGRGGGDGRVEYVSRSGRVSRITRRQARNYRRRSL